MLEAKTLTIKKSTNKSGKVVNFIPEMVDDLEVYSVVNKNNEHCGYITEDLFNFLMEQDPEEKENKALFHRALGVDDEEKEEETLIFGKKIILDVSNTKDINDFEKIILSPVTYTKGAKPLTIKIGTFFCIQNQGKLLDINVKSDFIECDNFLVSNLTSTTLNIDLNNKSPYFGGIHLYGIENFQNPGGEINLHIKANSKNGYSSINIHQLTIDSEKIGVKNPLHIGFEFGDGVLNASGARIDIPSSEKSTKKDYYMIGSATNGVDLGNSEITFLDGGSDKCSYLKAKGLLHAYSSKLRIGGTNIVNGDLTYSGNERKKALLIFKNFTSHSNLNIKSSADGLFNFIDTTISNGKKIITSEINGAFVYENIDHKRSLLRLINVNADLGNSYLQCQGQVELENVAIKNNDKVGFKNVSLYCSEVKKVFQLIGVNAYYTSFDNVYVGDTETGGFGFLKIGDKGDSPDSSILNTFKNVNIYMEGADTFIVKGGNALSFTSCDFNGNTYIETKSSNPSISYKVSATNSKFTNSSLRFSSHDGSGTMINDSEIEGNFVCDSVKEIASSYLENVKLESLDKVESCYLSAYIYENDGKRSSLINVNSNEDKKLPNDTKLEIL